MPKLNLLVFLNAYSDKVSTNNPSQNNIKWDRNINGLSCANPGSIPLQLAPGESRSLFNHARTLAQDNTTQYSLALKPLNSSIYVLSWVGGAAPNFRTPRTTGADATSQITVTVNGPLATFTSSGGTSLALISGGCAVGDNVRIGNQFSAGNQGAYKILALTATSLTVENESAVAEGPITLGSGFAAQLQVYSAAGVQVDDVLKISGGFSIVSQSEYAVTDVAANYLEFSYTGVLPSEGPITTQAIAVYEDAKRLVYLEVDQACSLMINGQAAGEVEPLIDGANKYPGIWLNTATIYSLSITNLSVNPASLFLASVE